MDESGATRTEVFTVGVVGVGFADETRQVPAGEPPPLPPNAELAVIGKPHPRLNGRAKVTGAIRFTVDVAPQGMLFARILRSPHPHAEVRAIDTSAAARDRARRSGACDRSLRRSARRRAGRDFYGGGGRGAASRPRRLQAARLRRRSRRGAAVGIRESLRSWGRAGKFGG